MTSLSFFSAVSRFFVCSKRLSTVTLCCIFCCSMSLSKVCKAFSLLAQPGRSNSSCTHSCRISYTDTCTRTKRFTHLSSKIRLSASLFSSQFCRSFNSPRRDVTWALRASLSFVSYKHKDDDHKPLQMLPQLGIERNGICILNHRLCLHLSTWTKSFSFCFSRASFLSLWTELFWRQSSFSWSSLYLHHSKYTNRINHPSYSSSPPNTPIHSYYQ